MMEAEAHTMMCLIWNQVVKIVKGDNAKQHFYHHMSHLCTIGRRVKKDLCGQFTLWTIYIYVEIKNIYLNVMTEGKRTDFELCEWANCSTSVLAVASLLHIGNFLRF